MFVEPHGRPEGQEESAPVNVMAVNVKDRDEIHTALEKLCRKYKSCEVRLGKELFTSIFLNVTREHFFVDLLTPIGGNEYLQRDKEVQFTYYQRSVPYTMRCRFLGRLDVEGLEALMFSLPQVIRYSNRRADFRVTPDERRPVRISIDFGRRLVAPGKVMDISSGGVAVRGGPIGELTPGQRIETIGIELPGEPLIICSGTVKRIEGSTVGIGLDELPQHERQQITRYVSERQKEDISSEKPRP